MTPLWWMVVGALALVCVEASALLVAVILHAVRGDYSYRGSCLRPECREPNEEAWEQEARRIRPDCR